MRPSSLLAALTGLSSVCTWRQFVGSPFTAGSMFFAIFDFLIIFIGGYF